MIFCIYVIVSKSHEKATNRYVSLGKLKQLICFTVFLILGDFGLLVQPMINPQCNVFGGRGFSSGSDQPCCRVEMFRASLGFRRKLIELKSRKHTQMARGQSLKVTKKHISRVSSSSCICLLYCTLGLLRECANICDKDMNDMDIEGGFNTDDDVADFQFLSRVGHFRARHWLLKSTT